MAGIVVTKRLIGLLQILTSFLHLLLCLLQVLVFAGLNPFLQFVSILQHLLLLLAESFQLLFQLFTFLRSFSGLQRRLELPQLLVNVLLPSR